MVTEVIEKENIMETLLKARPRAYFKVGELVECTVLVKQGAKLYDLIWKRTFLTFIGT